jgi:hypothetical protein
VPATVIEFPLRRPASFAVLARVAGERWSGLDAPMVQVAAELLDQGPDALRDKVRAMADQGAALCLLAETDRALAETGAVLALMANAIGMARARLRAAVSACSGPPELPAG